LRSSAGQALWVDTRFERAEHFREKFAPGFPGDRSESTPLVAEIEIEGPGGYARPARDLPSRRSIIAALEKNLSGGSDECSFCLLPTGRASRRLGIDLDQFPGWFAHVS
jgi:hypothetical protein